VRCTAETNVPIEDLAFYHEAKYRGVLPQELVRQLAALTQRVLKLDGRDSSYLDENNRFLTARIARLANVALVAGNGRVDCLLIELGDETAFRLQRQFFSFEADDLQAPDDWRLATQTFGTIPPWGSCRRAWTMSEHHG
jgi:hypothetical protein